jgi:hypothetical protein
MKSKKILFAFILILSLTSISTFAQAKKLDRIIKTDYSLIECTISKISDKTVEYSLPGETMLIVLDVSQIAKIDYASGRTQTFTNSNNNNTTNTSAVSDQPISTLDIKQNIIAVLPIPYLNTDNLQSSEEISKFAQNDIYNKLIDKSSNIFPLTVQDLRTTNSLLHKAGINHTNIDETPIADLEKILGVDHLVSAKISYNTTETATSASYNGGNAKVSDNNKKVKTNEISTSSATTQLNYNYTVYFDLYRNTAKIYSETRKPFFKLKDSWMDSISYLLKRSPIYAKK